MPDVRVECQMILSGIRELSIAPDLRRLKALLTLRERTIFGAVIQDGLASRTDFLFSRFPLLPFVLR